MGEPNNKMEATTDNGAIKQGTLGELRVRTNFNPDANSDVDLIKQKSAELINLVENLKTADRRLVAIAQTTYEEAAMWAVKAATAGK